MLKNIFGALVLLFASFTFSGATLAQNFSAAESGGFKRLDPAQLKEFFSKEVTLRRVGTGQNDDLIFKVDGQHIISGYTRYFEEKGTWNIKGNELCWNLPSSKRCRFLYMIDERWRLVSDTGEIRSEGVLKK